MATPTAQTSTSAEFEKATEATVPRRGHRAGQGARRAVRGLAAAASTSRVCTHDAMRNFARSYGDDNPLYNDERVRPRRPAGARRSRRR